MTRPHTKFYAPHRNVHFHMASVLFHDTAKCYLRERDIFSTCIDVSFLKIVTYAALVFLHPLLQIYKTKRQEFEAPSNDIMFT